MGQNSKATPGTKLSGANKTASFPKGDILTGMDMLCRAQFLEGLAGVTFNTKSKAAGTNKAAAAGAIKNLLLTIDPTLNLKSAGAAQWTTSEGSTGLYKAAWLGANKGVKRTQGAIGTPLEASDVLSANMLRFIDNTPVVEKMTPEELEAVAETAVDDAKKQNILDGQLKAALDFVLEEVATGYGNFFWMAGKSHMFHAESIVRGEVAIKQLESTVARYAMNLASQTMLKLRTEAKKLALALRIGELPGAGEDRANFDATSMNMSGWDGIVQRVLADPTHPFSVDFFNWLMNDVLAYADLTENETTIFRPYLEMVIDGNAPPQDNTYAKSIGKSPAYFAEIKKKFLDEAFKLFKRDPPDFLNDAENTIFLLNAQQGRGRFAGQATQSSGTKLLASLIRLAHANPELRPHLLPLLKEAADENPFDLYEGHEKVTEELEEEIALVSLAVESSRGRLKDLIKKHSKLGTQDSERVILDSWKDGLNKAMKS